MDRPLFTLLLLVMTTTLFSQSSCLIDCYASVCDENKDVENFTNKVADLFFRDDTLFISLELVDNCAYASEQLYTNAEYTNDTLYLSYDLEPIITDTLYQDGQIIYEFTSSYYECDCCFELMFLVKGIPHDSIPIRLNNKLLYTEALNSKP